MLLQKSQLFFIPIGILLRQRILAILLLVLLSACSLDIKDVELPRSFMANASEYKVSGTNTLFDDKYLNFGPYDTRNNKKGSVSYESSKLLVRKNSAQQLVSFTMISDSGLRSVAKAVGKVGSRDRSVWARWLRNEWWYLKPVKRYTNFFSGSIKIEGHGDYEFVIPDAYSTAGQIESEFTGFLMPADDKTVEPLQITHYDYSNPDSLWLANTEATILINGDNIVAALQQNHPKKIWFSNDASELNRFLAANVLGLMALRLELKEKKQ